MLGISLFLWGGALGHSSTSKDTGSVIGVITQKTNSHCTSIMDWTLS